MVWTVLLATVGQWCWHGYSVVGSFLQFAASLPPTCRNSLAHAALTCGGMTPRYYTAGFAPLQLAWGWLVVGVLCGWLARQCAGTFLGCSTGSSLQLPPVSGCASAGGHSRTVVRRRGRGDALLRRRRGRLHRRPGARDSRRCRCCVPFCNRQQMPHVQMDSMCFNGRHATLCSDDQALQANNQVPDVELLVAVLFLTVRPPQPFCCNSPAAATAAAATAATFGATCSARPAAGAARVHQAARCTVSSAWCTRKPCRTGQLNQPRSCCVLSSAPWKPWLKDHRLARQPARLHHRQQQTAAASAAHHHQCLDASPLRLACPNPPTPTVRQHLLLL